MVEHMLIVQWFIALIPHGGPIVLFLIPVCVIVSINDVAAAGFLSLSKWSFTIYAVPYNHK